MITPLSQIKAPRAKKNEVQRQLQIVPALEGLSEGV